MEPSPAGQAQFATLTLPDGKTVQLPILEAHVGPPCLDVRALYSQTGYFTYDPGFTSTASCDVSLMQARPGGATESVSYFN